MKEKTNSENIISELNNELCKNLKEAFKDGYEAGYKDGYEAGQLKINTQLQNGYQPNKERLDINNPPGNKLSIEENNKNGDKIL